MLIFLWINTTTVLNLQERASRQKTVWCYVYEDQNVKKRGVTGVEEVEEGVRGGGSCGFNATEGFCD